MWKKRFVWPVSQGIERCPKLGGQSRITYAVAAIFISERLMKDILGVTIFYVEKILQ